MNEKKYLEAIMDITGDNGDKHFKKLRRLIIWAFLLLGILGAAILFFPDLIGLQIKAYSFVLFFFFGVAITRWDHLTKFNRIRPYINRIAIKDRLDEIDT